VPNEDSHTTLQFLGEVDFFRRAAMMTWLPEFIFAPVTLTLDRIGYWPRSGIVWLGPQKTPHELVEGVQRLSNRLRAFGFSANCRGLKAYITLARNARSMKRFDFEPLIWVTKKVVLVASERLSDGARYSVLVWSSSA